MNVNKNLIKNILLIAFLLIMMIMAIINISTLLQILLKILSVLSPVLIGIVIAYIVNLPMCFFESSLFSRMENHPKAWIRKCRRPLSMMLSYILVFGAVIAILIVILPTIAEAVFNLALQLPNYANSFGEWLEGVLKSVNIEAAISTQNLWREITNSISDVLEGISTNTVSTITKITSDIVSSVISIFMGIIISIYLLNQKERFVKKGQLFLYAIFPRKVYEYIMKVFRLCNRSFSSFLSGQCMEALLVGVVALIGMLILGMPYPAVIASLLCVCNLVPMFGPMVGAISGTLLVLLIDPLKALIFLIFIVIWQQIEANIIYPKVVGKNVGIHPLLVITSVIVGGAIGGILGILICIPLSGVVLQLVTEQVEKRIQKKQRASVKETKEE